jgi:hypothetical protein
MKTHGMFELGYSPIQRMTTIVDRTCTQRFIFQTFQLANYKLKKKIYKRYSSYITVS